MIRPGENILLDAGSTVGALAHELRGFETLSVTTPGINTLQELADSEGIEVDCLGGRLRSLSQSFVGPLAEAALERMSFDRVFLGADAVTAEDGICEADHAQTRLKELMAPARECRYVLADAAKLGQPPVPRLGAVRTAVDTGDRRRRGPGSAAQVPGRRGRG